MLITQIKIIKAINHECGQGESSVLPRGGGGVGLTQWRIQDFQKIAPFYCLTFFPSFPPFFSSLGRPGGGGGG